MAKVYISCHHPDPANELAAELYSAGHAVVSTWHGNSGPRPPQSDAEKWQKNADENFHQITTADALIVVASLDHIARTKCVSGGKFVEVGYALGYGGIKVFTLGGVENGILFASGVTRLNDVSELLRLLLPQSTPQPETPQ